MLLRAFCCLLLATIPALGAEKIIPEGYDYSEAMLKVAGKFKGRPGVVLHIGDSITYSNPYGAWARGGEGKTDDDKATLKWMHAGDKNERDGWYLASFDHPDDGRSYTACSGITIEQMLAGGKQKMPPMTTILDTYKPQVVILMLGTNDATGGRKPKQYQGFLEKALDEITQRGIVPIVSTIPPHINAFATAQDINEVIREVCKDRKIPVIDFEKEITTRRKDDWNGTLMKKNDVHPTADQGGTKASSAPTDDNLKNSGYLLRGWLTVQKVTEVKKKVIDLVKKVDSDAPPKGASNKTPITRDTWVSIVGDEADGSNGASPRMKIKAYQEMSIIDFDPKPFIGKKITGAYLHVKLATEVRLLRVGVSTIAADWVEGRGASYSKEKGASTFKHRQHPDQYWTVPGSDLCSVMFSEGGTIWSHADASEPEQGWQRIRIDPRVIQARVSGGSYGLVIFDDTGSEWTRDGEKFTFKLFPNRYFYSNDSNAASAPYLTIFTDGDDKLPPEKIDQLTSDPSNLPGGQVVVSWKTPKDAGTGVSAFEVKVGNRLLPRYLIPDPGPAGTLVKMHLRDLNIAGTADLFVQVTPIDGAGNRGETTTATIKPSQFRNRAFPENAVQVPKGKGELPKLGEATVFVVDELDKLDPVSGKMIPEQTDDYKAVNHLWNATKKTISLAAAKNEFVAFQVAFQGKVSGVKPAITWVKDNKIEANFLRYRHVAVKEGHLPDPLVTMKEGLSIPSEIDQVPGQNYGSIYVDLFVPKDTLPGTYDGKLTLALADKTLELPIVLQVWDFQLPDHLSFIPDMNAYGVPGTEHWYYRQAHRHRTVLNILPYSQRGDVTPGFAPGWNGVAIDVREWAKRFEKYFDGSAFSDLPRKGVPLECFFLPLHENWPTKIDAHYSGGYWADECFSDEYRQRFVAASKQFAEFVNERQWHDTLFQCFLNNKVDYKRNGWSRGSSPWLLDEPASYQDFHALRYFAQAFREGVSQAQGPGKVLFRADISRPMWQRNSLDGLLDYNVVNSDFRRYRRMVLDRKDRDGQLVIEYGTANSIETSNVQGVAWSLDAWTLGADGVLPWLTVGTKEAWTKAQQTSLFYPSINLEPEPTPSVRLKAYRRGQQDVEYLTILGVAMKEPRWSIGTQARFYLDFKSKRVATGVEGEDAGELVYQLKPQDLWAFRMRVGQALNELKPAAKDKYVELWTKPATPGKVSPTR